MYNAYTNPLHLNDIQSHKHYLKLSQNDLYTYMYINSVWATVASTIKIPTAQQAYIEDYSHYVGVAAAQGHGPDYSLTGRVIDPAPGAWFIPKFISLAQVVPGPI